VPERSHPPDAASRDARTDIRAMSLDELAKVITDAGERPFRARQAMAWLWKKGAESFDLMRDVPAALRDHLRDELRLTPLRTVAVRSADGTRKLLFTLGDDEAVEGVIIPTDGRVTLCISSQVGCAMGCGFCATARMKLHRNLNAAEIAAQVIAARRELDPGEVLTNYVFMGMGEPLANYNQLARALTIMTADWGMGISPRRITVSTVGLLDSMNRLLSEFSVNLAVSLHATTDDVRSRIVPINRRFPIDELIESCKRLPIARRSRITFEYVMLAGINDSLEDARRLAKLLGPLRAKVNLLQFNPFPDSGFAPSPPHVIEAFQARLMQANLTATVRRSRGQDIAAACGQLYAERPPAVARGAHPFA